MGRSVDARSPPPAGPGSTARPRRPCRPGSRLGAAVGVDVDDVAEAARVHDPERDEAVGPGVLPGRVPGQAVTAVWVTGSPGLAIPPKLPTALRSGRRSRRRSRSGRPPGTACRVRTRPTAMSRPTERVLAVISSSGRPPGEEPGVQVKHLRAGLRGAGPVDRHPVEAALVRVWARADVDVAALVPAMKMDPSIAARKTELRW